MSATIKVGDVTAVCEDYHWRSVPSGDAGADERLAEVLNGMLDPDGPTGWDPNPDLNAARRALEELGTGELVSFDRWGDFDPEAIY